MKRPVRRTGLELYGCLVWLAVANELRTASMGYADSEVRNIKGLLLSVA